MVCQSLYNNSFAKLFRSHKHTKSVIGDMCDFKMWIVIKIVLSQKVLNDKSTKTYSGENETFRLKQICTFLWLYFRNAQNLIFFFFQTFNTNGINELEEKAKANIPIESNKKKNKNNKNERRNKWKIIID